MQAAILKEPGKFIIEQQPVPEPEYSEVLIRTGACGICTSELDMWTGHTEGLEYPRFIGHEVSGTIVKVGEGVTQVNPGDRVAVYTEGKGYAEFITVDVSRLYVFSSNIPFDLALGEPIACSVNGVRKLKPQFNDSVVLIGSGFMGLIMIQLFALRGAGHLIAVDTRDSMLELAEKYGATHTINPVEADVPSRVREITGGVGADIGIEAAGKQATLDLASQVVRMEGKLEIFGFHQGLPRKIDLGYWNWMAFQIINGHSRSADIYVRGMEIGLRLLEDHKLQMDEMITHRFDLKDINRGFEIAVEKPEGFIKGVIDFKDSG